MFHWKDNCLVYFTTIVFYRKGKCLSRDKKIKVSRFNDNETGQQIRKLV